MCSRKFKSYLCATVFGFATLVTWRDSLAVTCLGKVATIVGTAIGETINGTAGDDVIAGLGGGDFIYGDGGNDTICGGNGNDFLDGEAGNDLLSGGRGNDTFADQGGGIDSVDYRTSPGGVAVFLDNSNPSSDGFGGQDSFDNIENIYGSPYGDQLTGTSIRNVINGRGGDDFLYGEGGNDQINGGNGTDTANGGPGVDNCVAEALFNCP